MASVSSSRITRSSSTMSLGVEVEVAAETDSAFGSNIMSTIQTSDDTLPTGFEGAEDNGEVETSSSPKELNLSTLTPKEIYDKICQNKKINGGYICRALIKKMNEVAPENTKFTKATMAKNRPEQLTQCNEFLKICEDTELKEVAYTAVEDYMFRNAKHWNTQIELVRHFTEAPPPEEHDEENDAQVTPTNLRARVATLAVADETRKIFEQIYRGITSRAELDDKTQRGPALWKEVADIFNSVDYNPAIEGVTDTRCAGIDCSLPPTEAWSPEKLRSVWNSIRSQYTRAFDNYHKSGMLECNEDFSEGDDEFFQRFAQNDEVLLFIHLLWGREPPSYCTRLLPGANQSEQGITTPQSTTGGNDSTSGSSKKRNAYNMESMVTQATKMLKETLTPILSGSMHITLDETAKDRNTTMVELMKAQKELAVAEADRAKCTSVQERIQFLQTMLKDENLIVETRQKIQAAISDLTTQLISI